MRKSELRNFEHKNPNLTDDFKLSSSSKRAKQDEQENNEFDKFKVKIVVAPQEVEKIGILDKVN